MAVTKDIAVSQGHTYTTVLRWEVPPIVYKPITGITCPNAAARLEVVGHGLVDGWRCGVTAVKGMTEINATANDLRDSDYHQATVIDADTIELNDVNASGFKPYVSGGFIQYNTPATLTGQTFRVRLKTKKGGTVVASSEVSDAPLNLLVVAVDPAKKTIAITFPSTATSALGGKSGWYDVEAVSSDVVPVVAALVSGGFKIEKE